MLRLGAVALLALTIIWAARVGSLLALDISLYQCVQDQKEQDGADHHFSCFDGLLSAARTATDDGLGLTIWLLDFIERRNGTVTALSTAVIACFTLVLARATRGLKVSADQQIAEAQKLADIAGRQEALVGRQTDIIDAQKSIARLHFIADKRPRLRIRHVVIDHPSPAIRQSGDWFVPGKKITGSLVVVNAGGTSAKVIESRYRFYWGTLGLPMDPPLGEKTFPLFDDDAPALEAGESRSIRIESADAMDGNAKPYFQGSSSYRVYVLGQIRYADVGYPPIERFMGFCREYRPPSQIGAEGHFRAVTDEPDYDYED